MDMLLITKKSTQSFAGENAGGKGYNLYLLSSGGFNVPEWIICGKEFFREYRHAVGLSEKIQEIMLRHGDDLAKTEEDIHALIMGLPLPAEIEQGIREGYARLGKDVISVRSSAIDEDSPGLSFAGQLNSYLYISSADSAVTAIKKCWAGAYSARGLYYRRQNSLETKEIDVAVIMQEMINSDRSGVAFTADPVSGSADKVVINSVYGVGEGLVSGHLDADTYVVDKKDLSIISRELVEKKTKLCARPGREGCGEFPVEESLRDIPSLDDRELKELAGICVMIEDLYIIPQDIEWAWHDGTLYILQARPITSDVRINRGVLNLWDNSNIIESYGGLTLPLTCGFARYVYHQVYVQFCEILLIPPGHIREMDFFLRNMLGVFYGRIYYNLFNWYKLTGNLPGFKYNRSFMETMMGTGEALPDELADRIRPPSFHKKPGSRLRRLISGMRFFYFHLTIRSIVDKFLKHFYIQYDRYRMIDYSKMGSDELLEYYHQLERVFLTGWKAPIINDFLCMVHFGLLKRLCASWLPGLGEALQNDLLAGDGNLESTEPTREIIRIAEYVRANGDILEFIRDTRAENCMEALNQSDFTELKEKVADYIHRFGFRCMNEMKLEQKDLWQEPKTFFVFLKNQLNTPAITLEDMRNREERIRNEAESRAEAKLGIFKRVIFFWSLKHARRAVRNRENLRFCRTRVYGIVRTIFCNMGRDLVNRGALDRYEDIFYLSIDEVTGTVEGTNPIMDLKALVKVRKKEYERFSRIEPDSRFMTRGPVYWLNSHSRDEESGPGPDDVPEGCLKGIPCCPGVVEGEVKVIMSPEDDLELNGEVLVAMRTDPGWVPLYPSASALLVERGGLLSHSAIVAREMGLPAIVSIKGLTKTLKTGMRVRMDGEKGLVEILE